MSKRSIVEYDEANKAIGTALRNIHGHLTMELEHVDDLVKAGFPANHWVVDVHHQTMGNFHIQIGIPTWCIHIPEELRRRLDPVRSKAERFDLVEMRESYELRDRELETHLQKLCHDISKGLFCSVSGDETEAVIDYNLRELFDGEVEFWTRHYIPRALLVADFARYEVLMLNAEYQNWKHSDEKFHQFIGDKLVSIKGYSERDC